MSGFILNDVFPRAFISNFSADNINVSALSNPISFKDLVFMWNEVDGDQTQQLAVQDLFSNLRFQEDNEDKQGTNASWWSDDDTVIVTESVSGGRALTIKPAPGTIFKIQVTVSGPANWFTAFVGIEEGKHPRITGVTGEQVMIELHGDDGDYFSVDMGQPKNNNTCCRPFRIRVDNTDFDASEYPRREMAWTKVKLISFSGPEAAEDDGDETGGTEDGTGGTDGTEDPYIGIQSLPPESLEETTTQSPWLFVGIGAAALLIVLMRR